MASGSASWNPLVVGRTPCSHYRPLLYYILQKKPLSGKHINRIKTEMTNPNRLTTKKESSTIKNIKNYSKQFAFLDASPWSTSWPQGLPSPRGPRQGSDVVLGLLAEYVILPIGMNIVHPSMRTKQQNRYETGYILFSSDGYTRQGIRCIP